VAQIDLPSSQRAPTTLNRNTYALSHGGGHCPGASRSVRIVNASVANTSDFVQQTLSQVPPLASIYAGFLLGGTRDEVPAWHGVVMSRCKFISEDLGKIVLKTKKQRIRVPKSHRRCPSYFANARHAGRCPSRHQNQGPPFVRPTRQFSGPIRPSGNVAMAELRTHLATERVRVVALRLKQAIPSSIPTVDPASECDRCEENCCTGLPRIVKG
jgi:hypothetical protein